MSAVIMEKQLENVRNYTFNKKGYTINQLQKIPQREKV